MSYHTEDFTPNEGTWLWDFILGETGKPLAVLASVLTGLRALWPNTFGYNEMLRTAVLLEPLDGANSFATRTVSDVDVGIVQERLQSLWSQARREGHRAPGNRHQIA